MRIAVAALSLALVSACVPMPKQEAAAPAQAPAPAKVASTDPKDPNTVICRRYEETGTRLRQTKICKTRQEWDDDARLAQESLRGVDSATQPGGGN